MSTPVEVGQTLGPLTVPVTRTDLVRYAGASGDFNPIHHSDAAAAALGLPGVVAHGMLTMGLALRVVTDWVGADRVSRYAVRFVRPVVVLDAEVTEVTVTGEVVAVEGSTANCRLDVVVADQTVLGQVRVEVRR